MKGRWLDWLRVDIALLVAVALAGAVAMGRSDQEALPVGAAFLGVVVFAGLSGILPFAEVVATVVGSLVYVVLENQRGHDGLVAWALATASLALTAVVVRLLEVRAHAAEGRLRNSQTMVDELTLFDESSGLLKRRYGELALEEEVNRARRSKEQVTLVVFSADPAADHPLEALVNPEEEARVVGALLHEAVRVTDRAARLEQGVFAVILPATPAEGGKIVAEKLRQLTDQQGLRPIRCGVATFPDHAVSAKELLAEADSALRLARMSGLPVMNPGMLEGLGIKS